MKFLSEKDALTSLYNRRYITQHFPKLAQSVDRKQQQLMLYFIDVDRFKTINDTHGHKIGDQVLQRIASALLLHTQKKDIVVRWAGDEFLILAPFSVMSSKETMIGRIQNELKLASQAMQIAITVSIGTAAYPEDARSLEDLLMVVDKDMYTLKSKRSGIGMKS